MKPRMMPRQGDITVDAISGEIVKAGSEAFNLSMVEGFANRLYFKVNGKKSAFADYDVSKDTFNKSDKIIKQDAVSQKAIDSVLKFVEKYKALISLQEDISSLPKGRV